jgi:RNA polymerase sigma-70 factor (ECF subfamily)
MWLLAALARMRPAAESQAEDLECLRRVVSGDQASAAGLYDRHARPVYSLILRIVGDEAESEDVLQDVFAQAFRQAARYDGSRGPVAAWLLMMARSRSIDRLRARRARPDATSSDAGHAIDEMPGSSPDAASVMLDEEQALIVQGALSALPLIQRVAIELAYYDGLSHREIAERLEEPLGTVKTRIRLGLLKLRDALTEARL